jgi:hypothetical protein
MSYATMAQIIKSIKFDSKLHKQYKTQKLNKLINANKNLAPQGSKEWLALREYNIGGSEMSTITGENAFSSIDKLVAQKIGLYKFEGNAATRWGNLFESITQTLMEMIFDIDKIHETGSLEGAVKHQRYSPDGIGVVKMVCEETINDECIETIEYCIVLFEYKSPFYSIPSGNIPKYYIPQVKTGLCSIPIADFAIFVSNMFRKCSFDNLQNNNKYDTIFHNRDEKKKFVSGLPLAMGIITFYQTRDQFIEFCDLYIDSDDIGLYGDSSDSDTDDPSNVFNNIGNQQTYIKPHAIYNYIYNKSSLLNNNKSQNKIHQPLDFGKSYYTEFDIILKLCSEKLLTAEYCEPCLFDKYYEHEFLQSQSKTNKKNKSEECCIQVYKNKIQEKHIIGYIPWKLFKSDIIYKPRDELYVHQHEQKINDVINIIKKINTKSSIKQKAKIFKQYFPKSKVLKDAGIDNSHIMEFLPKFL